MMMMPASVLDPDPLDVTQRPRRATAPFRANFFLPKCPCCATAASGILYCTTSTNEVLGIRTSDGSIAWTASVTSTPDNFTVNETDRVLCSNGGPLNPDGTPYTGPRQYTYGSVGGGSIIAGVGGNRMAAVGDLAWSLGKESYNGLNGVFTPGSPYKVNLATNTPVPHNHTVGQPLGHPSFSPNVLARAPDTGDIYLAGWKPGDGSAYGRFVGRYHADYAIYPFEYSLDARPNQSGVYTVCHVTETHVFLGYLSQYDLGTDFAYPCITNGLATRLDVYSRNLQTRHTPLSTQFIGPITGYQSAGGNGLWAMTPVTNDTLAVTLYDPGSAHPHFLARLAPDGTLLWTVSKDSPTNHFQGTRGLTTDPAGNIYLYYHSSNPTQRGVRKYSPTGILLWHNPAIAIKTHYGLRVAL